MSTRIRINEARMVLQRNVRIANKQARKCRRLLTQYDNDAFLKDYLAEWYLVRRKMNAALAALEETE